MSHEPNPPILSVVERGWETTVFYADGTCDAIPTQFAKPAAPVPGVPRMAYRRLVVRAVQEQGCVYRCPWEVA